MYFIIFIHSLIVNRVLLFGLEFHIDGNCVTVWGLLFCICCDSLPLVLVSAVFTLMLHYYS